MDEASLDTQHHRSQAVAFWVKSRLFQSRRLFHDLTVPVSRHPVGLDLADAPLVASHRSFLWPSEDPAEIDLTAGKVQNLRLACRALDGLEIPAGQTFSFWKQLGRTTRLKGYVPGRELREGCIMPNVGGGLCQLSNALYDAALQAGFIINERHAHSKVIPGSLAALGRDATVFWNYVDLRFTAPVAYRIEAHLSKDHLILHFRSAESVPGESKTAPVTNASDSLGNCLTCNHAECFRSNPTVLEQARFGKTAFLLDAHWPEHDEWCASWAGAGALYFTPLDGHRWKKANYAWTIPAEATHRTASLLTLRRSRALRNTPAQGAALQSTLLRYDALLAHAYARQLDYTVKHLVISQNLLPHLWQLGVLGGRTFDVLMTRWPMAQLQALLDDAAKAQPESGTLTDFRAEKDLLAAERAALEQANYLITPHTALAEHLSETIPTAQVELVPWKEPSLSPIKSIKKNTSPQIFFPASPLARKGAYEVGEALRNVPGELLVLGRATESTQDPLAHLTTKQASLSDLIQSDLVILPAYLENQPRLLLRALALGKKVIATKACGLPEQEGLTVLEKPSDLENGFSTKGATYGSPGQGDRIAGDAALGNHPAQQKSPKGAI